MPSLMAQNRSQLVGCAALCQVPIRELPIRNLSKQVQVIKRTPFGESERVIRRTERTIEAAEASSKSVCPNEAAYAVLQGRPLPWEVPVYDMAGNVSCRVVVDSLLTVCEKLKDQVEVATCVPKSEQELLCGGLICEDMAPILTYVDSVTPAMSLSVLRKRPLLDYAKKRVSNEVRDLMSHEDIADIQAGDVRLIAVTDDLSQMNLVFRGPDDTPYEGVELEVCADIPSGYPFKPPVLQFVHIGQVFHPDVSPTGHVALDILRDLWSPAMTVHKSVQGLCSVLAEPLSSDGCGNPEAARLIKDDPAAFMARARACALQRL